MSRRSATQVACSLLALTLALLGFGVALGVLSGKADSGSAIAVAALVGFSTVGALVASRRPEHPIGWIFCATGLTWAIFFFALEYGHYAVEKPGALPAGTWVAWLQGWIAIVALGLIGVLTPLLFPDGRLPSPRWRPVALVGVAFVALTVLASALSPGPLTNFDSIRNPTGIESAPFLDWLALAAYLGLGVCIILSVASLFVRLRRSRGQERQQLKWVALTAALMIVTLPGASANILAFGVLFILATVAVPISIGVAILKYRLYEIDRIVNRTLVYGALTVGLAGLYFGIVVALQQVFSGLTRGNDLAIAGSTLAVAALFRPARRRIQGFVDRRFYRQRYDAQQTLQAFSARLRDEVDLDQLGADLGGVVHETMQPAHVSLWLRTPEAER